MKALEAPAEMLNKILNKFDFGNPQYSPEIVWLLVLIWSIVVACVIWSILTQKRTMRTKLIWIAVVVLFPLVGVLAYIPFSLKDELYPFIGFWRDPK